MLGDLVECPLPNCLGGARASEVAPLVVEWTPVTDGRFKTRTTADFWAIKDVAKTRATDGSQTRISDSAPWRSSYPPAYSTHCGPSNLKIHLTPASAR